MAAAATRPAIPAGISAGRVVAIGRHVSAGRAPAIAAALATGGVTLETASLFIGAGAIAIGMGGWLLGDGEVGGIRERAAAVVAAVQGAASPVLGAAGRVGAPR